MAAGSLLFLISLVGCMGTLLDSKLLFAIHTLISITAIVFEIILIIFVWKLAGGERLQLELSNDLKYHIDLMEQSAKSRNFLDLIQLKLQCCGAYSFVDYKTMNLPVPQSCSNDLTNNINFRSCGEVLRRYLEIRGGIMGGLGISLALLQTITTGLSLAYCRLNTKFRESM